MINCGLECVGAFVDHTEPEVVVGTEEEYGGHDSGLRLSVPRLSIDRNYKTLIDFRMSD